MSSGVEQRSMQRSYRMPAEWEPHAGCWMAWPELPGNWREGGKPAQRVFADVARAISRFEPVTVCASTDQWEAARAQLPPDVRVVEMSYKDVWLRDIGPTFVVKDMDSGGGVLKRQVAGVDWNYNGYGGTGLEWGYADFSKDLLVARKICDLARYPRIPQTMVMEGGSFHVDGEGTLLTTEECLLSKSRNPSMTREEIEATLKGTLGVEKVIWIPRGLHGDEDTTGHVDNIACFARPGVVLLAWEDNEDDPQRPISEEAFRVLSQSTDARGRPLQVLKVPMPRVMHYTEAEVAGLEGGAESALRAAGKRMAASYVNFYIANGGVVAPAFGDAEKDKAAEAVLRAAFPEREVVMVAGAREIILGGGNIHCITQQEPASSAPRPGATPGPSPRVSGSTAGALPLAAEEASSPRATVQLLDMFPTDHLGGGGASGDADGAGRGGERSERGMLDLNEAQVAEGIEAEPAHGDGGGSHSGGVGEGLGGRGGGFPDLNMQVGPFGSGAIDGGGFAGVDGADLMLGLGREGGASTSRDAVSQLRGQKRKSNGISLGGDW